MPGARGNQDGVARTNRARLAVDLHAPATFEDEVELLGELVVMTLRRATRGDARLGEALILHWRITAIEDASDGRAILGGKRSLRVECKHGHAGSITRAMQRATSGKSPQFLTRHSGPAPRNSRSHALFQGMHRPHYRRFIRVRARVCAPARAAREDPHSRRAAKRTARTTAGRNRATGTRDP